MNRNFDLRDYRPEDAQAVNAVALSAFQQYAEQYERWEELSRSIGQLSLLADDAEIIVAATPEGIGGAVAYVAPGCLGNEFIPSEWAYMRLLVVDPAQRGAGMGQALAHECIRRARRDCVKTFALHTSPMMEAALSMYIRLGFEKLRDIPDIHGVPYSVYKLDLS